MRSDPFGIPDIIDLDGQPLNHIRDLVPMRTADRLAIHAGHRTQKEVLAGARLTLDDVSGPCPVCGKRAYLDVYTSQRPDGLYEVTQYRCDLAITRKPPKHGRLKTREGAHPIHRTERKLEDTPMPPLSLQERNNIRALRSRADLTTAQLAEKLGMKSGQHLSVVLSGDQVSDAMKAQILKGCAALEKELAPAAPVEEITTAVQEVKPEGHFAVLYDPDAGSKWVEGPPTVVSAELARPFTLTKPPVVAPEKVISEERQTSTWSDLVKLKQAAIMNPVDIGMELLREMAPEKRTEFVQLLMDGCQLLAQEEIFKQAQSRFLRRTA